MICSKLIRDHSIKKIHELPKMMNLNESANNLSFDHSVKSRQLNYSTVTPTRGMISSENITTTHQLGQRKMIPLSRQL